MEQDLITYEDKVALDEQPSVADINKVKDTDMNQIKNVINGINNGSQPLNNLVVGNIESKNLLPVESSFTVTSTQRQRDVFGLNLKANQEYTLSCTDITSTNPYQYLFYFNVGQSSQFTVYLPNTERSITFTPTADVNTVRIYSSNSYNASANYTTTYTNLMIEKGDTVTDYTPYKSFDSTAYVLWNNPNPTASSFAGQTITLSDAIENYKYYEILFFDYVGGTLRLSSTGKLKTNYTTTLRFSDHYVRGRSISSLSGTSMVVADGYYYASYGSGTQTTLSYVCVPYQVLGYK